MKIYVTKSHPHDYVFAGADRFQVWFTKPYFTRNMCICPVFGLLDQSEFQYARWEGDNGFFLKALRKTQSKLFFKIWNDVRETYINPDLGVVNDNYDKARGQFRELNHLSKYLNPHSTKLSQALQFHIELKKTIFCEQAVEKVSWREWVGEYDIDMISQ